MSAAQPATATIALARERRQPEPRLLAADAFDLLPKAVMVCDRRGRVVAANARLRAELGAAASCCALLGCGRPGTELEDGCITARALEHGDAIDEVCVESAAGPMRVSAAPLYQDLSHVVVELRPDRRHPSAGPGLRIFTFGRL